MATKNIVIAETENFIIKARTADWTTRTSKTRISADVSQAAMEAAIGAHPAWDDNEGWKSYNRKEVKVMKTQILEANKEFAFLPTFDWKMNFSRKAGCSCGCSPAFILTVDNPDSWESHLHLQGQKLSDVWLTAK